MLFNRIHLAAPRSRSKAFTLVEMMIVVAIIGLLATLVINRYTHGLKLGQAAAAQAQVQEIAKAIAMYRVDKLAIPSGSTINPAIFGGTPNQYMSATPLDRGMGYNYFPGWNNEVYLIEGTSNYDGSSIPGLRDINGSVPVPGSTYVMAYTPARGVFVWGPL